jgi:hypothetical protein
MSDVLSDYQKWKQQGESLRTQARQAMEARFRELLVEAVRIAGEYRQDFGGALKIPAPVTAFRYKGSPAGKAGKAAKPKPAAKAKTERAEAPPQKPDPRIATLQKRLAATRKKLDDAKSAGSPTRALEDRVYEIEDELRLAGHSQ